MRLVTEKSYFSDKAEVITDRDNQNQRTLLLKAKDLDEVFDDYAKENDIVKEFRTDLQAKIKAHPELPILVALFGDDTDKKIEFVGEDLNITADPTDTRRIQFNDVDYLVFKW